MLTALLGAGFSMGLVSSSEAVPITYTFSATGTGTFDGQNFSGVVFTITASADLNLSPVTQVGPSTYTVACTTANVYVPGIGTGSLINVGPGKTDAIDVVLTLQTPSNPNTSRVGISSVTQSLSILFDVSSQLNSYNLNDSIGTPIAGTTTVFNSGTQFATSDGNFDLTASSGVNFLASIPNFYQGVPDAAPTFASLLLGLAAIGGYAKFLNSRKRLA